MAFAVPGAGVARVKVALIFDSYVQRLKFANQDALNFSLSVSVHGVSSFGVCIASSPSLETIQID